MMELIIDKGILLHISGIAKFLLNPSLWGIG
jgi:hypothetical protein